MADRLLIDGGDGDDCDTRAALIRDGRLVDVRIDRPGGTRLAGSIHRGRVVRLAPGMRGAFVDIGLERPGFLAHDARGGAESAAPHDPPLPSPGQTVLVQVVREADGGKGVRLSTRIALASALAVLVPASRRVAVSRRITDDAERARLLAAGEEALSGAGIDCGCVVRTQARGASADDLLADLSRLDELWRGIRDCRAPPPAVVYEDLPPPLRALRDLAAPGTLVLVDGDAAAFERLERDVAGRLPALRARLSRHEGDTPLFEASGVEDELRRALEPGVPLPGGGRLVIEETEALTAVDVDAMPRAGDSPGRAALRANLEAAAELPRQLRLRNIGGVVVADFIGMKRRQHREEVLAALRAAARDDPASVRISGISALGLVEIARARSGPSLSAQLTETCPHCRGLGRRAVDGAAAAHTAEAT